MFKCVAMEREREGEGDSFNFKDEICCRDSYRPRQTNEIDCFVLCLFSFFHSLSSFPICSLDA